MQLNALDTKTKILLAGLFVVCILLLLLAFSLVRQSPVDTNGPSASPVQQKGFFESLFSSQLSILTVDPNYETLLPPNHPQTFTATFNKSLRLDAISASLQETIIPTGQTSRINVSISAGNSEKIVLITPQRPLKPYASYVLTIFQKNPEKILYKQTYGTQNPLPSPVEKNNTELKNFLPYQTATYELSYREDINMYVFNFIYNPDDPADPQQQFENAQRNARLYMQSKGINPDTVVVDWRFR